MTWFNHTNSPIHGPYQPEDPNLSSWIGVVVMLVGGAALLAVLFWLGDVIIGSFD